LTLFCSFNSASRTRIQCVLTSLVPFEFHPCIDGKEESQLDATMAIY